MDLEESDFTSQVVGDAQLMNNLPRKSELVKSGLIGSIAFCDGKSCRGLFDFMTTYPDFIMEFHSQGLIIKQCLMHKPGVYDTVSYMVFKGSKQYDYTFCPENIPGDGPKDHICVKVNSATVFGYVKKNKATTSIIFELKNNSRAMTVTVINGVTKMPYYLTYTLVPMVTYNLPETITNPDLPHNIKITSELFSSAMNNMGIKHENVLYDFKFNIFKDGISLSTNAPGVGSIPYGNTEGQLNKFSLKHQVAKRLAKIHKIGQRTPVAITCLDNSLFKIWLNVGSYSEMVIYQFPDPDASDNLSQYSQYMLQYGQQTGQIGNGQMQLQQGSINHQMVQYQQQMQYQMNPQMQMQMQRSITSVQTGIPNNSTIVPIQSNQNISLPIAPLVIPEYLLAISAPIVDKNSIVPVPLPLPVKSEDVQSINV